MARPRTVVAETEILDAYRAGTSISAIAIDHDISRDIVRRVVREAEDATVLMFRSSYAPKAPDGHVTSVELQERAGITYRQLDYWTRTGYLRTSTKAEPGTGNARFYPASEVPVAALAHRLLGEGLSPAAASRIARELVETGTSSVAGIRLDLPEVI